MLMNNETLNVILERLSMEFPSDWRTGSTDTEPRMFRIIRANKNPTHWKTPRGEGAHQARYTTELEIRWDEFMNVIYTSANIEEVIRRVMHVMTTGKDVPKPVSNQQKSEVQKLVDEALTQALAKNTEEVIARLIAEGRLVTPEVKQPEEVFSTPQPEKTKKRGFLKRRDRDSNPDRVKEEQELIAFAAANPGLVPGAPVFMPGEDKWLTGWWKGKARRAMQKASQPA